jgi:hypothetical protein
MIRRIAKMKKQKSIEETTKKNRLAMITLSVIAIASTTAVLGALIGYDRGYIQASADVFTAFPDLLEDVKVGN